MSSRTFGMDSESVRDAEQPAQEADNLNDETEAVMEDLPDLLPREFITTHPAPRDDTSEDRIIESRRFRRIRRIQLNPEFTASTAAEILVVLGHVALPDTPENWTDVTARAVAAVTDTLDTSMSELKQLADSGDSAAARKLEQLEGNECMICTGELRGQEIAQTKCGHLFCLECVAAWVFQKKHCPACRTKQGIEDVKKLVVQPDGDSEDCVGADAGEDDQDREAVGGEVAGREKAT